VNILAKEAHALSSSLTNIAESYLDQAKKLKTNRFEIQYDSDMIESDSSGNCSESDQINKFLKFKYRNNSLKQEINGTISDQEYDTE
jgi:lipopolysaccharide export system protein LptC